MLFMLIIEIVGFYNFLCFMLIEWGVA